MAPHEFTPLRLSGDFLHFVLLFLLISLSSSKCLASRYLTGNRGCSSAFPQGRSYCVHEQSPCPPNTIVLPNYDDTLYCNEVDQKCCGTSTQSTVVSTTWPWLIQTTSPRPTPTDQNGVCGRGSFLSTDRIFNGIVAGQCDWPFVVSIRALLTNQIRLSYSTTIHACAGVLVHPQWVLTSPFCVLTASGNARNAPNRILVVAGEYDKSDIDIHPTDGQQQEQIMRVERVIIHPNYRYTNINQIPFDNIRSINGNGVAMIKLSQPIINRCAGVACLPAPLEVEDDCISYEECIITGWGLSNSTSQDDTNLLKLGLVQLSSKDTCNFITDLLRYTSKRPTGTICQTPLEDAYETCLGDEGGAVLCNSNGLWVVRAVIPFNMCVDNNFNLYVTDVTSYLDWIEDTMQEYSP